jgi:hypothetical protein
MGFSIFVLGSYFDVNEKKEKAIKYIMEDMYLDYLST